MRKIIFFILLAIYFISINGASSAEQRFQRDTEDAKDGCNAGDGKKFQSKFGFNKKIVNIAVKAAQEAKEAVDAQAGAAETAAHDAKYQLAEKAMAAAKAAEAALAGKEMIVEQLQHELREAEAVIVEEMSALEETEVNMQAAILASQQAQKQVDILKTAIHNAKENIVNSEQAANGLQSIYNERSSLVEAAKNRVEMLIRQLGLARDEYEKTRQATAKATDAAKRAYANVERNKRKALRRALRAFRA